MAAYFVEKTVSEATVAVIVVVIKVEDNVVSVVRVL